MIWGPPGTGKTVLACQTPRSVLIEVDPGGSMSLNSHPEIAKEILVVGSDKIKNGYSDIMGLCKEIRRGGLPDRDTFIIDTTTTLASQRLRQIVRADAADSNSKFSGTVPELQHYNALTVDFQDLFLEWCDLPRNVIFICHDLDEKDEMTQEWTTRISHTPKLSETILTLMDAMFYLTANYPTRGTVPPTRTIRAMPTNRIRAKTRLGVPPTFPAEELWKLVKLGSTVTKPTTGD